MARACDTDLKSYAQENLFFPIDAEAADWEHGVDDYNWGWGTINVAARDMAKFGLLYLNGGEYVGDQVPSADWVRDSLQRYSDDPAYVGGGRKKGSYFGDFGYREVINGTAA